MRIAILTSPRSGSSSLYGLIEKHLKFSSEKWTCVSEPFGYWRTIQNAKTYDIDFFENKKNVFIKTFVRDDHTPNTFKGNYAAYSDWFFNYFDKVILLDRQDKNLQSESLTFLQSINSEYWHKKQYYDLNNITIDEINATKKELIDTSKIIHSHTDKGFPLFYFEEIFINKNKNKILELFDYIGLELNSEFYYEWIFSDLKKVRLTEEELKLENTKLKKLKSNIQSLKFWNSDGFDISFNENGINLRKNKTHTKSGGDNTEMCSYSYNELGFRGDSIKKEGFKVMSLGCSITEGIGVNYNETWPAQFSNHIKNGVNMNFGVAGKSNDFICRCLLTYYDLIKPDLVLIMYTYPHRREVYTKNNFIQPYMPTYIWAPPVQSEEIKIIKNGMDMLQNDNEDFINWYKNHQIIKYFLESKKCNWIWNGSFAVSKEFNEFNRYDGNYKNKLDLGVDDMHPGPIHNRQYSMKLFEYLKVNFRNYLPDELNTINPNFI